MDRNEESIQAVNYIIRYCKENMSCDDCAIRWFCTEVRKFGLRFSLCDGYKEEDK